MLLIVVLFIILLFLFLSGQTLAFSLLLLGACLLRWLPYASLALGQTRASQFVEDFASVNNLTIHDGPRYSIFWFWICGVDYRIWYRVSDSHGAKQLLAVGSPIFGLVVGVKIKSYPDTNAEVDEP